LIYVNNICIYTQCINIDKVTIKTNAMMETKTITKWSIDPAHTEIIFKAKHLVISSVSGKFNEFYGDVETEGDNFENAQAEFIAKVASITTGNNDRDNHLKSDDFFNAEKYPELKFKSTSIKKVGDEEYKMKGDLTIRDITKPIELDVLFGGIVDDPYGNTKAGFEITGNVSRKEYGLKWNAVTEAGSVVVGDKIKIGLNVQVSKEK
jgi:polyisoprenoid-binding protein YceI